LKGTRTGQAVCCQWYEIPPFPFASTWHTHRRWLQYTRWKGGRGKRKRKRRRRRGRTFRRSLWTLFFFLPLRRPSYPPHRLKVRAFPFSLPKRSRGKRGGRTHDGSPLSVCRSCCPISSSSTPRGLLMRLLRRRVLLHELLLESLGGPRTQNRVTAGRAEAPSGTRPPHVVAGIPLSFSASLMALDCICPLGAAAAAGALLHLHVRRSRGGLSPPR